MTLLPVNPSFLLELNTDKLCPHGPGLVSQPVMTLLPVANL